MSEEIRAGEPLRGGKDGDAISRRYNHDDGNDEDEDRSPQGEDRNGYMRRKSSVGSPRLKGTHSKQNYLDSARLKERDARDRGKPSRSNFTSYRESAMFSDDGPSSLERSPRLHTETHRVPYFRYFGPTAIVPGFKEVVVSVREHRRSMGAGSSIVMSPDASARGGAGGSVNSGTPSQFIAEPRGSMEMPIYDPSNPLPINRLILHLAETFFAHLGSNYPFLRPKSFIQRVEQKLVEPILVNAVCGLAARFSDHPLLTHHATPSTRNQNMAIYLLNEPKQP
jgi:hypothetical protein